MYAKPKLFACLFTYKRERILKVTKKVSRKLFPVKTITPDDLNDQGKVALKKRLGSTLLGRPILEKYEKGETFFGIYDPAKKIPRQRPVVFAISLPPSLFRLPNVSPRPGEGYSKGMITRVLKTGGW